MKYLNIPWEKHLQFDAPTFSISSMGRVLTVCQFGIFQKKPFPAPTGAFAKVLVFLT
jgi:hypothetical protein